MFWIPDNGSFYSTFIWHEFAIWRNGKVSRSPGLVKRDAILPCECPSSSNNQAGIYASIFAYNSSDMDTAQSICPMFFDLDSKDLSLVQQEAAKLYDYLAERIPASAIHLYFSGGKGFHIVVEPIALGITPQPKLAQLIRFIGTSIAKDLNLTTVDPVVFEQRRMWRMVNTEHQGTGLYKVEISRGQLGSSVEAIKAYACTGRHMTYMSQKFNPKANEWFREWDYKKTESEQKSSISIEERIKRFQEHGSTILKDYDEAELVFNPLVFEQCHALGDLWRKSETERELSHYERLFLLSILSYTDEALEYLRTILKQCDDFNEGITEAHIQDWIKRRELGTGGHPFSCRVANGYGVGCGDCDLEPKEKLERVGNKLIPTGEMAEPSPFRYAYERNYKHGKS